MKTFRIEIQFFTPDRIPTSRGTFTIEALNENEAIRKQIEILEQKGCQPSEMKLIWVKEVV